MDIDEDFDFINNDIKSIDTINDYHKDTLDFPIFHSTPSISRLKQQIRSIDYPSMKKHYGIVTFLDYQLPIIYRLINDSFYIPYIRFSYVLNIFEHSLYKKYFVSIQNLPIIEMTSIEQIYYNQLSSLNISTDWSNNQLLSVSILDGTLAILDLIKDFYFKNNSFSIEQCKEWRESLNRIRQQARDQWILDEKIVLKRLTDKKDIDTLCISSTNIAKRRIFFEQRLDLSIVDEAGGFIQIDSYIYPFIKNSLDNQIYINLNDIQQKSIPPLSYMIYYSNKNSSMYQAYTRILEQAQSNYDWNLIRRNRNNELTKVLPSPKRMEENLYGELKFISLHHLLKRNLNINFQFIQLFETSSLDEIELNYKNNIGRQFIMGIKRQGALINDNIPCIIFLQYNHKIIWIPSDIKTQRIMTNDERLYLNIILLYHGLWKNILTKKKQWYLKEFNENDKENMNIEILFDTDRSRRNNINNKFVNN